MTWIVASVPFWALGGLFLLGAFAALPMREPHETSVNIARQIIFSLLASSVFFYLAAKVCA